jgi:hypothetical protein
VDVVYGVGGVVVVDGGMGGGCYCGRGMKELAGREVRAVIVLSLNGACRVCREESVRVVEGMRVRGQVADYFALLAPYLVRTAESE